MERCINRLPLQNPSMVFGSYGVSYPITKARVFSASFGVDLSENGLKQNQVRPGCRSTVAFGHRKSNKNFSLSSLQARCTSDAQELVEVENSVEDSTSRPTQSVSDNRYTENGLELVKSLEGTDKEILEVSLRRDPASDELKGPGWLDSGTSLTDNVQENNGNNAGASHSNSAVGECVHIGKNVESVQEAQNVGSLPGINGQEEGEAEVKGIWQQIKDIIVFAGPALGIWLSPPIMSLIDTAVIGNSSSVELAALGPGTVMCDQLAYIFMFLSIATSNLIATSLAKKDRASVEKHISQLLLVAMTCGIGMFLLIQFYGTSMLKAFVGVKNYALVPAARTYVEIRGYAWPAVLVGMVAQSASLGMQDSWGPLKVLAIASLLKVVGDIFLCIFLRCGIAGAAWATTVSQIIAALLMLRSLHHKGYNSLAIVIPSKGELLQIIQLSGPVLLTMISKIAFYTVVTYLATSLGAITLAAHQVMIGVYSMCSTSGEPLAQTAQSFMPDLIYGVNRNIRKAQKLLQSLIIIGTIFGISLGSLAGTMPWFFPHVFTRDAAIVKQMQGVTMPFFFGVMITPSTLSLEGTLLATRDFKYFSFSMVSCFCGGCILLLLLNNLGYGLVGSWWTLVAFQWARFAFAFLRIASARSVMMEEFKWFKSKMHFKTV